MERGSVFRTRSHSPSSARAQVSGSSSRIVVESMRSSDVVDTASVRREVTDTWRDADTHQLYELVRTPKYNVVEKIVEVPQVCEKDIMVEVPEVHHHTILQHLPKVEVKEVTQPVEVAEVHWEEDIKLIPEWKQEKVTTEVERLTVKEVFKPVVKRIEKVEEEVVEVPMPLPTVERIIERPIVDFKERLHYVKGQCEMKKTEEVIEVPHIVEVPKVQVITKPETRHVQREVVVPHIERVEEVLQVPREEIIERTIEVPEVHTQRNIRFVPKFETESVWVENGQYLARGMSSTLHPNDVWYKLKEARRYITQLEQQKSELQVALDDRLREISDLRQELVKEKRANEEWAAKLRSVPRTPTTIATSADLRTTSVGGMRTPLRSPATSYEPSPPRRIHLDFGREVSPRRSALRSTSASGVRTSYGGSTHTGSSLFSRIDNMGKFESLLSREERRIF